MQKIRKMSVVRRSLLRHDISCALSANGCDIVVAKQESNEASALDTCTRLCINRNLHRHLHPSMYKQESNESGDISCALSANGCDIVVDKQESNEASALDTCTRLCINRNLHRHLHPSMYKQESNDNASALKATLPEQLKHLGPQYQ